MVLKIYFLRHGESVWNKANVFTGWADVDLSPTGMQEAVEAGQCIKKSGLKFDVVFTSVLRRSVKTAWTALIHSENFSMPIINTWRLNERHYGALQGLNKAETAAKYGDEQVKIWRRSYDIPPPHIEATDDRHPSNDPLYRNVPAAALPGAESLALTTDRVLPFWHDQIAPCVMAGKTVLISAHGNSLRALCKHLEKMSEKDVLELNIPTAVPLCYELDEKLGFIRKYYLMDPEEVARKIAAVEAQGKAAGNLTADLLEKQDSETSQTIIDAMVTNATFLKLSDQLCQQIMQRDTEDGVKLAKGIQLAVDKGVLPADVAVEPTTQVHVTGKTADQITNEIIAALGDAPSKGCVLTLQGLSGTGKGTTVAKLKEKLPNCQTWSNGNVFRSLTLLAVTYSEQKSCTLQDALKPEALSEFCGMLSFDKFRGKFDVKIEGLGLTYYISDIEKTVLKEPRVATCIPTVAEVTQGEVVSFVAGALAKMAAGGINVLVEGREQTLNHIRTPHRFELVLEDNSSVGKRQAALQVGAIAWEKIGKSPTASKDAVNAAIDEAIKQLCV